jgi:hypothetical protein
MKFIVPSRCGSEEFRRNGQTRIVSQTTNFEKVVVI